ncbi:hypothetical protein MIR68_004287 [Amoeboaphelidium protococcarum]|nr:hypothetical protein MIR68_004287 [Amoeboaphelidium protococcarum]
MKKNTGYFWLLLFIFATTTTLHAKSEVVLPQYEINKKVSQVHYRNITECISPEEIPVEERCQFVRDFCLDKEHSPSLIPYMELYYCQLQDVQWLGLILFGLQMIFLFVFLGTAASDYFCPNLSTLSNLLSLPQEVAGVTLLAVGNGASDLISSLVAINQVGSVAMGVGEIIGAGLFVAGIVAGAVVISSKQSVVKVERGTFVRDIGFLMVAVLYLGVLLVTGQMFWWQGLLMVGIYASYVMYVFYGHIRARRKSAFRREETQRLLSDVYESSSSDDGPQTPVFLDSSSIKSYSSAVESIAESIVRRRLEGVQHGQQVTSIVAAVELKDAYKEVEDQMLLISDPNSLDQLDEQSSKLPPQLCDSDGIAQYEDGQSTSSVYKPDTCLLCNDKLSSEDEMEVGTVTYLAYHAFPILKTWRLSFFTGRVLSIINAPALLLLSLTTPVVELSESECGHGDHVVGDKRTPEMCGQCSPALKPKQYDRIHDQCCKQIARQLNTQLSCLWIDRWIIICQMFIAPLFALVALKAYMLSVKVGNNVQIPSYAFALVIGSILAVISWYVTNPYRYYRRYVNSISTQKRTPLVPISHPFLAFVGFLVGLLWIYCLCNEVVGLMKAFGKIFDISDAILGITVFALGNSVGDLVSNVTLSRMGLSRMSFAASFASPLMNILMVLGISGLLGIGKPPAQFQLNSNLLISYSGLLLMVLFNLIYVPLSRYRVGKMYGYAVIVWYTTIMALMLVLNFTGVEFSFLHANDAQ